MGKSLGVKKMTPAQIAANRANAKKGGRPAGGMNRATINRALLIEDFRNKVAAHLEELIQLAMENARGVLVAEDVDDAGRPVRVYKAKPDQRAIDSLISKLVGDPPKAIELESKGPSTVNVIHQYSK